MADIKEEKQKSFRGFIYEFLVVFVAVFLGYLADNYREHLADKAKERQYAINLISDLKRDSTNLAELISFNRLKGAKLDSL